VAENRATEDSHVIDISLEMEQHDCPFIDTTLSNDVSFSAVQWEFDDSNQELETRMVVRGEDPDALDGGLDSLRDHTNMRAYHLQSRRGATAQIRTKINETDAMARIRNNDGFITGPFYIEDGSEMWHVGFDTRGVADDTLSELDRNNEFAVLSRDHPENALVDGDVEDVKASLQLVEQCKQLTTVERETLTTAVENGYFESPREMTLGELAEEFGVSKPAVSKNLRRAQQKVASGAVRTLDIIAEN
jgi:predicted DNA binding protein